MLKLCSPERDGPADNLHAWERPTSCLKKRLPRNHPGSFLFKEDMRSIQGMEPVNWAFSPDKRDLGLCLGPADRTLRKENYYYVSHLQAAFLPQSGDTYGICSKKNKKCTSLVLRLDTLCVKQHYSMGHLLQQCIHFFKKSRIRLKEVTYENWKKGSEKKSHKSEAAGYVQKKEENSLKALKYVTLLIFEEKLSVETICQPLLTRHCSIKPAVVR